MTIDAAVLAEARAWCEDVWGDEVDGASDADVVRAVRRSYDGGWAAFIEDGRPW